MGALLIQNIYDGGAEKKIRQHLDDENFADCVIQLPPNLFFGTSIVTCILVLKNSHNTADAPFINVSEKFVNVANNNKPGRIPLSGSCTPSRSVKRSHTSHGWFQLLR